jgi:dolichol-phosphate mannosyltransferase
MAVQPNKVLIFIPTYNESGNVERMCQELLSLPLQADLLFVDDNSPDGTGKILDCLAEEHPNLSVVHRPRKLGVGAAHLDGIRWAYQHGYETLVTMDCDFTHSPSDIPRLLEQFPGCDVVVGSRFLQKDSLPGWNLLRRMLTKIGHVLTRRLLGIRYDATGAFRVYRLSKISADLFHLVSARSYAFFFESLFVIHLNNFVIKEVPIVLPSRTYGSSKMSTLEAARSARHLVLLALSNRLNPGRRRLVGLTEIDNRVPDRQGWDVFWKRRKSGFGRLYHLIASGYRTMVLKPRLNGVIRRHFSPGASLLHAGCGGGQVDVHIQKSMRITALDISASALQFYQRNNPQGYAVQQGSIMDLLFADACFDGVYNLGVLEHFTTPEIGRILGQFHRVLKPGGKVVFFWPHAHGSTVMFVDALHWVLRKVFRSAARLYPVEISLLASRRQAESYLTPAGFRLLEYRFGMGDFFSQVIVVGEKMGHPRELHGA